MRVAQIRMMVAGVLWNLHMKVKTVGFPDGLDVGYKREKSGGGD